MVFSDPVFLSAFLPVCLVAYWLGAWRIRNPFVVLVGTFFYLVGGKALLVLLVASIALNHFAAVLIHRRRSDAPRWARLIVAIVIGADVGALVVWKYAGFAGEGVTALLHRFGWDVRFDLHLALPIAISFFTFQAISYVVDVWKGSAEPAPRLVDYAAYILLFPHLIAGPIVRYAEIRDDLLGTPRRRRDDFAAGLPRFFWGLAKKVLIADQVAGVANAAFALPASQISTAAAWIGAAAFSVQIYFDFSGYSDMAVGLARMFGFHFPENFDRPYSALSVTDFWRRWHISLSTWFRDYVYIPLGGNRMGSTRTYVNLWVVFLLTGLWHGASLVFVVWGGFHGALLVVERLTGRGVTGAGSLGRSSIVARRTVTLVLVSVGWVIFRSDSVRGAGTLAARMLIPSGFNVPPLLRYALTDQRLLMFVVGLSVFVLPRRLHIGRLLSNGEGVAAEVLRACALTVVAPLACVYTLSSSFSPFLYFRF